MLEWKLRAVAPPVAVALAVGFHASATGHWFQRTFLSMIVHELGHAVSAWLSGFFALPTVWKTLIGEARSTPTEVLVAALELALIYVGGRTQRVRWIAAGALCAGLQVALTIGVPAEQARALIIFCGDGGAMILGALLMCTFFAPAGSRLVRNHLRWGFLVIGAAAYVDSFATWWTARHDPDVIPFGEIEGVGLSDPSKLSEVYGWSDALIVHRFVTAGIVCGVALAAAYAYAVWSARQRAQRASD